MLNARSIRAFCGWMSIAAVVGVSSTPLAAIAPTAPTNLAAVVNGQDVTLTWTASQNAPTQYTVLAGFAPGQTIVNFPLNGATTSVSVAAPPGTYYVRIVASNADGSSAPSNEIVVNVTCRPGTPLNFRVMQKGAEAYLFWNPAAAATGYTVQAGFAPGENALQFALPGNTFNVLVPAGSYFARIVATNGCGPSAPTGSNRG